MARVRNKVPAFLEKQFATILKKSTWQLTIPVGLIFILTCIASFVAAQYGQYSFFLLAGSLFFMHGFLHIGQAIIMRKYIPALVTSLFIVIPYGIGLFWNLLDARIINISGLLLYFIIGAIIAIPFILIMHAIGAALYNGIKK